MKIHELFPRTHQAWFFFQCLKLRQIRTDIKKIEEKLKIEK
uniref:Uncharacterized protein n=1 Tax=Rhizophora mucronata TaxID=61149 RepID=A0A2P2IIS8_RHIMU